MPTSRASWKLSPKYQGNPSGSRQTDGFPHIPFLVRIAAWDERYGRVEESCARSPPGSAEEEQVGLSLPVAKAESARKAAKRPAPSGIAAPPPKRQCQAELQATMLAHMEEFARRLAVHEVSGVAPIPTPCSLSPAMLGIPAASRKSSSPALHETRTLCGAGADISRIRLPVKPSRAVPPKSDVPHRQPLDLAEVLAKLTTVLDRPRSSPSLEEEFGVDPGVATTETEHTEVLNGGGSGEGVLQRLGVHVQVQRLLRPRHEYPGVIISAREKSYRDGRRSLRRVQNRRIRTPARNVVSDLQDTRVCSEGQWPRLGMGLAVARTVPPWRVDQTSIGGRPRPKQSSHGTGKRRRSRQQRNN